MDYDEMLDAVYQWAKKNHETDDLASIYHNISQVIDKSDTGAIANRLGVSEDSISRLGEGVHFFRDGIARLIMSKILNGKALYVFLGVAELASLFTDDLSFAYPL